MESLLSKLVEYKEYGVILALIGLVIWLVKEFFCRMNIIDNKHAETLCKLSDTIKENTDVTKEMSLYLKLRNGSDTKKILEAIKNYKDK